MAKPNWLSQRIRHVRASTNNIMTSIALSKLRTAVFRNVKTSSSQVDSRMKPKTAILMPQLRQRSKEKATAVRDYTMASQLWNKSHLEHFILWLRGRQRQHSGPRCRIPELFSRKDKIYIDLHTQRLRWHIPAPKVYEDIFDVAKKVNKIEVTFGYTFNDKLLCASALKMSGSNCPLYFGGAIHPLTGNNRLALVGDRVLELALCEMWFKTDKDTFTYSTTNSRLVSRNNLGAHGRSLNIGESILLDRGIPTASKNMIAETFEAILGAIYVDSNYSVNTVKDAILRVGLGRHQLLSDFWNPQPSSPSGRTMGSATKSEQILTPRVASMRHKIQGGE
ncbi:ribonuclease III [Corynespora cassiicola Philippines]|uniref:Ribonuclease III n=1 Tax=Corynespora cassiicola Philippines TaxID=1448308 RepID=A0A2T2P4U9_CORCC|nr:ribonuclease III [Corynespora cassiicola Philippines]